MSLVEMGSSLYIGDLTRMLRGLSRAEFEAYALGRYAAEPEVAVAIAELADGITRLMDLGKWTQNRLRGIDWADRPAA